MGQVASSLLYQREEPGEMGVYTGHTPAKLLAVPLVLVLPDVLGECTAGPVGLGLRLSNLVLLVLFLVPAAALAWVTDRIDGGHGVLWWLGRTLR